MAKKTNKQKTTTSEEKSNKANEASAQKAADIVSEMTSSIASNSNSIASSAKEQTEATKQGTASIKEATVNTEHLGKAIKEVSKATITLASSALTSSAFGTSAGNIAGSIIGKALEGAATGHPIVGAIKGLVEGIIKDFNATDDVFKKTVKDAYDGLKQEQKDTLSRGIGYTLKKEQAISEVGRWKGDAPEKDIEYLEEFSGKIAVGFENLANAAATLAPAINGTKVEFQNMVGSIGYVGAALQLDSKEMSNVALAFAGLQKKVSSESFAILEQQGIDGYNILLEGLNEKYGANLNQDQLKKMVEEGQIEAAGNIVTAKEIAEIIGNKYQKQAEEKSNSYSGLIQRYENLTNTIAGASGQGYTEMRAVELKKQVEYMEGEGGERQSLANEKMGKWEAFLQNKKEELDREILDSILTGEGTENLTVNSLKTEKAKERIDILAAEYKKLEDDLAKETDEEKRLVIEAKQGNIVLEAKGIAENEYKASDAFQEQQNLDLQLVDKLQADTRINEAYYMYGKKMGNAFSKGLLSARPIGVNEVGETIYADEFYFGSKKAFGMAYVPYDNFPALLHQGERVLTAGQARTADGQARRREGVVVNIGDVYGNTKNDAYDIARILVSEITRACEVMA